MPHLKGPENHYRLRPYSASNWLRWALSTEDFPRPLTDTRSKIIVQLSIYETIKRAYFNFNWDLLSLHNMLGGLESEGERGGGGGQID